MAAQGYVNGVCTEWFDPVCVRAHILYPSIQKVELVGAAERAGLEASARSIREVADGFGAV
jgi:hypothetical protein